MSTKATTQNQRPAPYRIKDLVEKTGITKETIHYYIAEGLLPRAQKTSRNMGWYSDEHIERLQQIKDLQEKQFLPLKAIKAVLNDEKDFPFTAEQHRLIASLQRKLKAADDDPAQAIDLDAAMARWGVTPEEVAELDEVGLVPVNWEKRSIALENEEILRLWSSLRNLGFNRERGFSPRDMEMFSDIIDVLFNQEVEVLTPRFSDIPEDDAETMLMTAVMHANELLALLHLRKIKQFLTGFSSDTPEK